MTCTVDVIVLLFVAFALLLLLLDAFETPDVTTVASAPTVTPGSGLHSTGVTSAFTLAAAITLLPVGRTKRKI